MNNRLFQKAENKVILFSINAILKINATQIATKVDITPLAYSINLFFP